MCVCVRAASVHNSAAQDKVVLTAAAGLNCALVCVFVCVLRVVG